MNLDTGKKLPTGVTAVAMPYVSKQGFDGAMVTSLVFAMIYNGMNKCLFDFYQDYTTTHARNAAVKRALDVGADWLFFIDSDMDFPVDTLARLKVLDADIACADMWSRNWPSFRTVLRYGPKRGKLRELVPVQNPNGIEDVDCCGMACTLIKRSLLEKFAKKKLMPFVLAQHGEDASFCILAKQKFKASIRCDFGITAGHWGRARMVGQDFTRDARNQLGAIPDPEFMRRMGATNVANEKGAVL